MAFIEAALITEPVTANSVGAGPAVAGFGDTRGFTIHVMVSAESGAFRLTLQDSADGINWSNIASSDAFIGLNVIRTTQPTTDTLRLAWTPTQSSSTITINSANIAAS